MKHTNSSFILLGRSSIQRPEVNKKFRSFAESLGFSNEAIVIAEDIGKFAFDIMNKKCFATLQKSRNKLHKG